jgi:hypothetical protein
MEKIKESLIAFLGWLFENSLWIIIVLIAGYIYLSIRSQHTILLLVTPVVILVAAVIVIVIISERRAQKDRERFFKWQIKDATIDFQKDPDILYTDWSIGKHQYHENKWLFNPDEIKLERLNEKEFQLQWKNPDDQRDLTVVLEYIRTRKISLGVKDVKIYSFTTLFQDTRGDMHVEWIMYRDQHMAEHTGATEWYSVPAGWERGYQKVDQKTMTFLRAGN